MHVLITYDVETATPEGRKRLRHVAKLCEDWGQRVQNSVFECKLDPAQLTALRARLRDIIDEQRDSLRLYNLGNNWQRRAEHYGIKPSVDPDSPLIF